MMTKLRHKRNHGSCFASSRITHSGRSKLTCREDTCRVEKSVWQGTEASCRDHERDPYGMWVLEPLSGFQFTKGVPDSLTVPS